MRWKLSIKAGGSALDLALVCKISNPGRLWWSLLAHVPWLHFNIGFSEGVGVS